MAHLLSKTCKPCEGGTPPLEGEAIQEYRKEIDSSWEVKEQKKIVRKFEFESFPEGIEFVNQVAKLAEQENHHPDIIIRYKKVTFELTTHSIGGLSENDFILAAKIEAIFLKKL